MVVDYSIECALPYSDNLHAERVKYNLALADLILQIQKDSKSYIQTLLVDDMTNNAGADYDLDAYTAASTNENNVVVMRESMLTELCDDIYADIALQSPMNNLSVLKSDDTYSSSFYIAVWSLIRLGYIDHPNFPIEQISAKIVNILPKSFQQGEEISLDIVRKTQHPQAADQVEYIFVE